MAPPRRCVFAAPFISSRPHAHSNLSFPGLPDFSKEVTIIINEDQPDLAASFHVPEGLLTENSEFFQAACRNEWKEATSRMIKLPDVEPDIFSLYLFWVHRGKLAVRNERVTDGKHFADNTRATQTSLVKLWILADRLSDVRLCNTIIDEMIAATQICDDIGGFVLFPPDLTVLIWSATTAGRPIRQLIIDYFITYVYVTKVEEVMDDHHPDFLKELMVAALHIVDVNAPNGMTPSERAGKFERQYHDHVEALSKQD